MPPSATCAIASSKRLYGFSAEPFPELLFTVSVKLVYTFIGSTALLAVLTGLLNSFALPFASVGAAYTGIVADAKTANAVAPVIVFFLFIFIFPFKT